MSLSKNQIISHKLNNLHINCIWYLGPSWSW